MLKRIVGFLLLAWMVACLYGLIPEMRGHDGPMLAVEIAIAVSMVALALIGLKMMIGKSQKPAEPKSD